MLTITCCLARWQRRAVNQTNICPVRTCLQAIMAEGAAMRPEALSPLDGALAVMKQYTAAGGGLTHLPCCGQLAGGQACPGAAKCG